jgi:hypothetical protein
MSASDARQEADRWVRFARETYRQLKRYWMRAACGHGMFAGWLSKQRRRLSKQR